MRPTRLLPFLLALALGLGAAGLAACGGGSSKALIPSQDAGALNDDFDQVSSAVEAGDCAGATRALAQAQSDLDQMPARVSKRLRARLQLGINTLRRQAADECVANQTQTETATTETNTTPTTETNTTPTTPTVPTTTTPPPTTTLPPPTPTAPPDNGGGVTAP